MIRDPNLNTIQSLDRWCLVYYPRVHRKHWYGHIHDEKCVIFVFLISYISIKVWFVPSVSHAVLCSGKQYCFTTTGTFHRNTGIVSKEEFLANMVSPCGYICKLVCILKLIIYCSRSSVVQTLGHARTAFV